MSLFHVSDSVHWLPNARWNIFFVIRLRYGSICTISPRQWRWVYTADSTEQFIVVEFGIHTSVSGHMLLNSIVSIGISLTKSYSIQLNSPFCLAFPMSTIHHEEKNKRQNAATEDDKWKKKKTEPFHLDSTSIITLIEHKKKTAVTHRHTRSHTRTNMWISMEIFKYIASDNDKKIKFLKLKI